VSYFRWESRLAERFADRLGREHPNPNTYTTFGRNVDAMKVFGELVSKLRMSEERIVINEVGVGFYDKSSGIKGHIMKQHATYETFELLNELKKAGVKPGRFVLNAIDIRRDALLAVKSTKVLRIDTIEAFGEHFKNFFPELQEKMKDHRIPVRIPKEYRERVNCMELDIESSAVPEAHITFSFIQKLFSDMYLENLVKSTMKGGYILTHVYYEDKTLDRVGLERAGQKGLCEVYQVK
jgi:hypothetical protein